MIRAIASVAPLVGLLLVVGCGKAEGKPSLPTAQASAVTIEGLVPTARVSAEAVPTGVTATGTLHASRRSEIGPKKTGVIRSIGVDEGDRVKKGQILFALESGSAGHQIEQAKAAVVAAESSVQSAKLELDRTKRLHDGGALSPAALDQAKAAHEQAQAGLAQSRAGVAVARQGSQDAIVRAPFSGVITDKRKDVGESASLGTTVVVVLETVDVLEARVALAESELATVHVGDEVELSVRAAGVTQRVTVSRIGSRVDEKARTVEIILRVDNAAATLLPGMFAEARFKPDSARVPNDVATRNAGEAGAP